MKMLHKDPPVFIDPTMDFGFKRLFGQPGHESVLVAFLNLVLRDHQLPLLVSVELLDKELLGDAAESRRGVVALSCRDERGQLYLVEMQVQHEEAFFKRALYYMGGVYRRQLRRGAPYGDLQPLIFVALTNFVLFPESQQVVTCHHIAQVGAARTSISEYRWAFVELCKFKKAALDVSTPLDQWLYLMTQLARDELLPKQLVDPFVREAADILNEGSLTPAEQQAWERQWLGAQRDQSVLRSAVQRGAREAQRELLLTMRGNGASTAALADLLSMSVAQVEKLLAGSNTDQSDASQPVTSMTKPTV